METTTAAEPTTSTRDGWWGTSPTFGTRLVCTYLVFAAATVGVVGLGLSLGLVVAESMEGIEGLAPFFLILGISIVIGLGALPVLTLRCNLGWGSVVGLFGILGVELLQSMTTGELSLALVIAVAGPGIVAVVGHLGAHRAVTTVG